MKVAVISVFIDYHRCGASPRIRAPDGCDTATAPQATVERTLLRGASTPGKTLRIALIAHLRGGIVARIAAAILLQRWPAVPVRLFTFGTSHHGTWVFRRIGERWSWLSIVLDAIQRGLGVMAKPETIIKLDILRRACAYDIPAGFRDVEPHKVACLLAAAPPSNTIRHGPHGHWQMQDPPANA